MDYKVIYEISRFPFPWDSLITLFFALGASVYMLIYAVNFWEKRLKRHLVLTIICFLLDVLLLIGFIESITYGGSDEYRYAKQYYAGNYEVAEGKIENYVEEHSGSNFFKNFSVAGVDFEYIRLYSIEASKKHILKKNGQQVRICYIPLTEEEEEYGEPVTIVKIELLE